MASDKTEEFFVDDDLRLNQVVVHLHAMAAQLDKVLHDERARARWFCLDAF